MTKGTQEDRQSAEEVSLKGLPVRLKTNPKDLRRWLRAEGKGLGKRGKRYSFSEREATDLAREWEAAQGNETPADAS